jgi:branched-chain amino acid transport system permease protein
MGSVATLLALSVDGISYGMVLFLIASGLAVTLGIMRVVNVAHCGFAMIGGYIGLAAMRHAGLDLLSATLAGMLGTLMIGAVLERLVYRRIYRIGELGQILMTLGLTFVMVASINAIFGAGVHTLEPPAWLRGSWTIGRASISVYRSFLIAVSATVALVLWLALDLTLHGKRLRAAVENPRIAACLGIDVGAVMQAAFAIGCALAACGGVLGSYLLPLEPFYALRYMVLVLMVVAVGGLGSLRGSLVAALGIGILETFGRYYVPSLGSFVIYVLLLVALVLRPNGLLAAR